MLRKRVLILTKDSKFFGQVGTAIGPVDGNCYAEFPSESNIFEFVEGEYAAFYDETDVDDLMKKLRKARKEKKRWKNRYLELAGLKIKQEQKFNKKITNKYNDLPF